MDWSAYPFALLAILVIGGLARPTAPPCPKTVCEDGKQCYDYYAETYQGRYTGQWNPNTLSCFDRVPAVIMNCGGQKVYSFKVDEKPSDTGFYHYSEGFARDSSTMTTHSINNTNGQVYYLNANDCAESGDNHDGTYPLKKEAIWQICIPKDHVAHVVLADFDLEKQQSGSCINDFVSMYNGNSTPTKLCSSLDKVSKLFIHEEGERLTIKFQSNEAINAGGFSGKVWFRRNDTADAEGTAGTADVQQVHRGLEMAPAAEEEQNNNEDKIRKGPRESSQ